jgi:aspartyl/asparaginyl beta-hydroxylase (cupin superfamily)
MRAGVAALETGDALAARRHFESILAAGVGDAATCIMLGLACHRLKDRPALYQAVDRALAYEPRNLQALLMKGDCLAESGNARMASQFYGAAVAIAAQMKDLSPALAENVRRAAETRDRINAHIERHLLKQLDAAGYDERTSSPRFVQSIDMLTGKKQLYTQQPRAYYFPELPQIQFYPRATFPWLDALEAATDDICSELQGVLERNRGLVPYIQSSNDVPIGDSHNLLNSLDWSAFFLYKDGVVVEENAAQCPKTMAALEHVPFPRIKGRDPMALFSVLKPGVRIAPHNGFLNSRLVCHLPLIVPPGCFLRVGNDTREWHKGKAWVFDDSIEHEAWNSSNETRVILIVDLWRPELTAEEQGFVKALLEAMDTYAGPRVEWTA